MRRCVDGACCGNRELSSPTGTGGPGSGVVLRTACQRHPRSGLASRRTRRSRSRRAPRPPGAAVDCLKPEFGGTDGHEVELEVCTTGDTTERGGVCQRVRERAGAAPLVISNTCNIAAITEILSGRVVVLTLRVRRIDGIRRCSSTPRGGTGMRAVTALGIYLGVFVQQVVALTRNRPRTSGCVSCTQHNGGSINSVVPVCWAGVASTPGSSVGVVRWPRRDPT